MTPANIVAIRVFSMYESCERTTFYVELRTDEGFTMTPCSHRTGSVYTNFEGLTIDEARDRALIEAADWGDFLNLPVKPYVENGVTFVPSRPLDMFTVRRELNKRKKHEKESSYC